MHFGPELRCGLIDEGGRFAPSVNPAPVNKAREVCSRPQDIAGLAKLIAATVTKVDSVDHLLDDPAPVETVANCANCANCGCPEQEHEECGCCALCNCSTFCRGATDAV